MSTPNRRVRYNYRLCIENPELIEFNLPFHRKFINSKQLAQKYPSRLLLLLDEIPVSIEKQLEYSWEQKELSPNIRVKSNGLTVHRSHTMNTTDGARGRMGVSKGLHVWEIYWPICTRGTHATVGVVTASAPLVSPDYTNLIGSTADSWGWDIIHCEVLHDASTNAQKVKRTYPTFDNEKAMYRVASTFFMVLDMDAGTMSFISDGEYLGIACEGLQGHTLYPAVGCVWGNCEISLRYVAGMNLVVPSLKELCRRAIRENCKDDIGDKVNAMALPQELKTFILHKNPKSVYNARILNSVDY